MGLPKGIRLGTYEIVGPLGAGGMGEVYRAKDLRLGREVALKVLPVEVASSPDRLARFEREARTAAGLNHPNIVTLFSIEEEDGIRFLTMELIDGRTLSDLVAPGGLPLSRILELSIPLTDALAAAHERGVVHRDLKPGNVMVTRDGRVKVLDFGLAKSACGEALPPAASQAVTAESPVSGQGLVLGTVPYMAPEQLRGEAVDARADLFALGVIVYELAAGHRPFAGQTCADVTSAILRDAPGLLGAVRPDLPGGLERIVCRCLEKDPRARTQTALEVSNDLRALRRTLERGPLLEPPSEDVASIAVLPFVNRSRDEEDEYFSDGLADELINVLAKIRGLRVAARTSSFHFKGKDLTIAEVGQVLRVATVLEGSVRKAGNRVRISVQLVKVSDGYHLWSESYDRTLDDIFAVQDDIARSVVKELRTTLLGEEQDSKASGEVKAEVARAARGRGKNAEAHRLYLQARYLVGRLALEDMEKGIEYLKQALELEPGFALAWAELGGAYAARAGWYTAEGIWQEAREAAERALSLEPDLAEGHLVIAHIQMNHDWDWRGADASYRRALELAPGNAHALRGAGGLAGCLGRLEEGNELVLRALEQDPLSPASYQYLGYGFLTADRFAEAETALRKALELSPQSMFVTSSLSLVLLAQGRSDEALAVASREPYESMRLYALGIIYHILGRGAEADRALRELTEKYAVEAAAQIAEVHAVRGEIDRAFEWLERAYAQRDAALPGMKLTPSYRTLHGDPRWAAFLRKMGLEE